MASSSVRAFISFSLIPDRYSCGLATARFIVTELITNLSPRRELPPALTSPLTLGGSTDSGSFFGGDCTHLIGGRVEKAPSEIGVVDCSREDHRTDHRRE